MSRKLFCLSDEQWQRIERHLPIDVQGVGRLDDRCVIGGIVRVLKVFLCASAGTRNRVPWDEVDQEARDEDTTANCARGRFRHPVGDDKRTSPRAGGAAIAVPSHARWQRPNHPVPVLDWRAACAAWDHCMHGYAERPADVAMFAR